jgi:hypothetical protein
VRGVPERVGGYEAEHERMSRAMEFFRRRLAVMPDSPRQGHG